MPQRQLDTLLERRSTQKNNPMLERRVGGTGLRSDAITGPFDSTPRQPVRAVEEELQNAIERRLDNNGVKLFAAKFLDFYLPARQNLQQSNGRSGLPDIQMCNTYATCLGDALWSRPPNLRVDLVYAIQDQLLALTKPVNDLRSQYELPEFVEFRSLLRGQVNERMAYDAIDKYRQALERFGFAGVRRASAEEDIESGYDLVVTFKTKDGLTLDFPVDIKSARPFEKLSGQPYFKTVPGQPFAGIKTSRTGERVIVLDVDNLGFNGKNNNQFAMKDPKRFVGGLLAGIREFHSTN